MALENFSVAVTAMTTAAIIAASGVHLASSQQDEDDPCKNNPCQNGICLSNGLVFVSPLCTLPLSKFSHSKKEMSFKTFGGNDSKEHL